MKTFIFFPFYNIHADLVKAALGLNDNRSIENFFQKAGVPILMIGNKKCVSCEDLMSVFKKKPVIMRYEAQSELSRLIDEI